MDPFKGSAGFLTPEQFEEEKRKAMALAVLGNKRRGFEDELAQGRALMGGSVAPSYGWGAGLMNGLAHVLNVWSGKDKENAARAGLEGLGQQEQEGLNAYDKLEGYAKSQEEMRRKAMADALKPQPPMANVEPWQPFPDVNQLAPAPSEPQGPAFSLNDLASLGMRSGHPLLMQRGHALNEQLGRDAELAATTKQNELERLFQEKKFLAGQANIETDNQETHRHNVEMEKRPPGGLITPILVPGQDGKQYFVTPPPPKPGAPATEVVDSQGNPIIRQQPKNDARPVPESERVALVDMAGQAKTLEDLSARFKDEYAGHGPLGAIKVDAAQKAGSWASPADQEMGAFWADFSKFIDLPERNKTFGASLSAGEKSSWEGAKNIKPTSDPALIRKTLGKMHSIIQDKLGARAGALTAEGFNPEAISALTYGMAGDNKTKSATGLSPEKQARLEELRRKKAEGALK